MNLSLGDLPVNFPVLIESAPDEEIFPILFAIEISESFFVDRFQCAFDIFFKPSSNKLSKSGTFPVVYILAFKNFLKYIYSFAVKILTSILDIHNL